MSGTGLFRKAGGILENPFARAQLLLGEEAMRRLQASHVIIFGIGGVGAYAAEALVRAGIGHLDLVDGDAVCFTNLNRQLIATRSSVGRPKVSVMAERIRDINPDCEVREFRIFFLPETRDSFDFTQYDYIVDAVDTVSAKLALVMAAKEADVPMISCMGAGNKLDPTGFEVADIYQTSVCPLARVMRRECRKRGIDRLKVVYSREKPLTPSAELRLEQDSFDIASSEPVHPHSGRRAIPGSVSFVPPVAGMILGGEVVRAIAGR